MLRLRGGAGEEQSSSGSEDESQDEPAPKKSRTAESLFFDPDLTADLINSPTLPAKEGVKVKRRSNSCDGRLQGCIFFHSTPIRPGPGLDVAFKDDMDMLNNKIIDIVKKKRRQSMVAQKGKYEEVKGGDGNVSVANGDEEVHDDVSNDRVGDGDDKVNQADVWVHKEAKVQGGDSGVKDVDVNVNITNDNDDVCDDVCQSGDPYEFNDLGLDDSMGDPTFELPKEKRTKTFDTVKMWNRIQKGQSSKKTPTGRDPKKTPPSEFRKKRDATDETHWRQLGGSTPDEKQKRPGLNLKILEFLVHKEAKARGIDLARSALKLSFFNDLVGLYGDVPGANRLAPWKSGPYIMKQWRLQFCTKTTSKQGTRLGDVHIYEPPQFEKTPCKLCNKHQTPDVRDTMLDHFMKASTTRSAEAPTDVNELVKCPHCDKGFKSHKTLKNHVTVKHPEEKPVKVLVNTQKGERSTCPHCNSCVADLGRHVREDCRMQPKNLVECPHCFAKILKLRLKEHINGRVNKVTGVVTKRGCIDKQNEKAASDGKEKKVAPLTRCDECGKNMTQKYLPEHKRLFHKESKLSHTKDFAVPGPETGFTVLENMPSKKTVQKCLGSRDKQLENGQETGKSNGEQKKATIFYTREQWVHAVNEANFKIAQQNSKKDAYLNQAEMSQRGIKYLEQFGIRAATPSRTSSGELRFAPTDGDCLWSIAILLQNPDLSDDDLHNDAEDLRIASVGEAVQIFPNLSVEKKEQLRQACSPIVSTEDETVVPLTDEQVETLLSTYMQTGKYGNNTGDVLCYLLASHLRATLLVINVAKMSAYFVEPNIFNHERSSKEIYVLVHCGEHYEGLKLHEESKAQLEELYQTTFLDFEGQSRRTKQDKIKPSTSKSQAACEESSSRVDDVPKAQAVSGESFSEVIL